jgi:hypothetical protein
LNVKVLESRLLSMNTQTQLHELQAGESLALPGSGSGRFTLLDGEALFQPEALYLAGTAVVPPVRHLSAPASLALSEAGCLRATRDARVLVETTPGFAAAFKATLARLIAEWPVGRPASVR